MRIAVIGSGVSGLVCAHLLHRRHDVVLYEADERPGGHSHTHRVELPDASADVDTGFLVYNERTYPLFCRLLDRLGVATQPSDMSFSVTDTRAGLEWRGTSLSTVFAQRRNLARPAFWQMLVDIGRFHRLARGLLDDPPSDQVTLADVLAPHRWSAAFRDWYLIPAGLVHLVLGARRRSHGSPRPRSPVSSSATVCCNYEISPRGGRSREDRGTVRAGDPPPSAGSRTGCGSGRRSTRSAEKPGGIEMVGPHGSEVVRSRGRGDPQRPGVAHALRPRSSRSGPRSELSATRTTRATLHTDIRLLPRQRRAWASWNYHRLHPETEKATLTYHLNGLQAIPSKTPVLVTLNNDEVIDPDLVLARMDYAHPVLDPAAVSAQRRRSEISGSPGAPGTAARTGATGSTRTVCAAPSRHVAPWG